MGIFSSVNAQETIPLWEGKAPGSEDWDYQEKTSSFPGGGSIAQNVVNPTITAYLPDPSIANGAAIIVCPGGAFRMLSMDGEGKNVAMWLNKQGFAAFVLKYRLLKTGDSEKMAPMDLSKIKLSLKYANANPAPDNHELNNVIRLATSDGQQAIRLVRRNAEKWRIDPSKIGIMGCVALYSLWNEAGKSAELHVFSKGTGPFGIRLQGLPSDAWPDLFLKWIRGEGLI